MPTIVHFEIPSDNIERAKKFYNSLFGWEMEKMPGPMEYWMFPTANSKGEQTVGGGVMKRRMPNETITNYIDVSSVDEYAKKVEQLGGRVIVPKRGPRPRLVCPVHGHREQCICSMAGQG